MTLLHKLFSGVLGCKKCKPRARQGGNVYAMLFGAVALTGVLASVGMQTLTGPVTTITRVTQKNIADNNTMLNDKLVLSYGIPDTLDVAPKNPLLPPPMLNRNANPALGGTLPDTLGLLRTDPWGTLYRYCAWNHGSSTAPGTGYLRGVPEPDGLINYKAAPLHAIISAGPDRVFSTTCPEAPAVPTVQLLLPIAPAGSDDIVQVNTIGGAAGAGGAIGDLWKLDEGAKVGDTSDDKLVPKDTAPPVQVQTLRAQSDLLVGNISSLGVSPKDENIVLKSGAKLQTTANAKCTVPADKGTVAADVTTGAIMYCDGAVTPAWQPSGSKWTDSTTAGDIHRATGKVGIGKANPTSTLDVYGTATISDAAQLDNTLTVDKAATFNDTLSVANDKASTLNGTLTVEKVTTLKSNLAVNTNTLFVNASTNRVGVGTVTPSMNFQVQTGAAEAISEGLIVSSPSAPNPKSLMILPSLAAGAYNALVQKADTAIITRASAIDNGSLIVAPWSAKAHGYGMRMGSDGNIVMRAAKLWLLGTDASTGTGVLDVSGTITASGAIGGAEVLSSGRVLVGAAIDAVCGAANSAGSLRYVGAPTNAMQFCNGTNWQSISSGVSLKLDDLTDVSVPTPASNSSLVFDGTNWVASKISSSSLTLADALDFTEFKDGMTVEDPTTIYVGTTAIPKSLTFTSGPTTSLVNMLTINPTRVSTERGLRIGSDLASCTNGSNTDEVGTMRYNSNSLEICLTAGWRSLSGGGASLPGCADGETLMYDSTGTSGAGWYCTNVPDIFAFNDMANIVPGSVLVSNVVRVTGIGTANVKASISGPADARMRVNGGSWVTGPVYVVEGNRIDLRMTAGASGSRVATTLQLGLLSDTWEIFAQGTDETPNPFDFQDYNNVNPLTSASERVRESVVSIVGISGSVPVAVVSGLAQISIAGGPLVTSGTITDGQSLRIVKTGSSTPGTTLTSIVRIGSGAFQPQTEVDWNVYSFTADIDPNPFDFADVISTSANQSVSTLALTITGLQAATPVPVSLSGTPSGRISINGGAWVTSGNIVNGQTLALQMTGPADLGLINTLRVTVGLRFDDWAVQFNDPCAVASPAIGTVCADSTVYVGLSPDGNKKMYSTRCNMGGTHVPATNSCTNNFQTLGVWSNNFVDSTSIPNAQSNATGKANSLAISQENAGDATVAANICENFVSSGSPARNDWYLPAYEELLVLHANRSIFGFNNFVNTAFGNNIYWSSSEASAAQAYAIDINGGNGSIQSSSGYNKNLNTMLRCVRREN